jgi:hypothetical protein
MVLAVGDTSCSRPTSAARTPTSKDTLQIDRAFIGATDAWRDVTAFLRRHVSGDALSVTISQPFTEIGGDPASGKGKNLILVIGLPMRRVECLLGIKGETLRAKPGCSTTIDGEH